MNVPPKRKRIVPYALVPELQSRYWRVQMPYFYVHLETDTYQSEIEAAVSKALGLKCSVEWMEELSWPPDPFSVHIDELCKNGLDAVKDVADDPHPRTRVFHVPVDKDGIAMRDIQEKTVIVSCPHCSSELAPDGDGNEAGGLHCTDCKTKMKLRDGLLVEEIDNYGLENDMEFGAGYKEGMRWVSWKATVVELRRLQAAIWDYESAVFASEDTEWKPQEMLASIILGEVPDRKRAEDFWKSLLPRVDFETFNHPAFTRGFEAGAIDSWNSAHQDSR